MWEWLHIIPIFDRLPKKKYIKKDSHAYASSVGRRLLCSSPADFFKEKIYYFEIEFDVFTRKENLLTKISFCDILKAYFSKTLRGSHSQSKSF